MKSFAAFTLDAPGANAASVGSLRYLSTGRSRWPLLLTAYERGDSGVKLPRAQDWKDGRERINETGL
jgi:hypothetical protein